jgi:ectoine hydroxylase-related dioxygenase (phytanoyl-CoA dioxygenase family)
MTIAERSEAAAVLSPEDRAFFDENGYVVVHNAVPRENLDRLIAVIFEFLGMDPNDPGDWYRPPLSPGGMVEMYQHQALWDNRQNPRVHRAFSEILGTEKLWVSFDRAGVKPPAHPDHPEYEHKGFLHWDLDPTKLPQPFGVQGVLYLADTDANMGGFQCVPGHHKVLEAWGQRPPSERGEAPRPDPADAIPIPGKAGDLVIWNRLLFHGNGHNVSDRPRLAQYITMFPAQTYDAVFGKESQREERIHQWRNRLSPQASWAPGDPRRTEELHGKAAELTPLGRKLLGLDAWE